MNALTLPDIATQAPAHALALDWVGMQGIALPIKLAEQHIHARADIGVSLDYGNARGIHMSRLYLALHALEQRELNPTTLRELMGEFLDSHQGLSQQASITLRGEALLNRALSRTSPTSRWTTHNCWPGSAQPRASSLHHIANAVPPLCKCACTATARSCRWLR